MKSSISALTLPFVVRAVLSVVVSNASFRSTMLIHSVQTVTL